MQTEAIDFSPRRLLAGSLDMLAGDAAGKGLCLVTRVSAEVPERLQGDAQRIGQILINYLNNAIKFSLAGDIHASLSLEHASDDQLYLRGEVQDHGIGISAEHLPQLFHPFHQADSSITRRFGGTGLGLSISRNLARLMDGDVGVESREGVGSCFWFRVQVRPAQNLGPEPARTTAAQTAGALKGLRLLLVDDNDLNRLVGQELLHSVGIDVELASDGRQALDRLRAVGHSHFDAVLMDMMMPVDGLSATRELRQNPDFNGLPVIALSASIGEEDVLACLQAGMQAHIGKPIDERQLWAVLGSLLQPGPDSTPAAATPALQPGFLEQLSHSMPAERFQSLLGRLLADCRARQQRIRELADDGDWDALRKEAHDLVGTAGHAGLTRLAALGKALGEAANTEQRARVQALAQEIDEASTQAAAQLDDFFTTPA